MYASAVHVNGNGLEYFPDRPPLVTRIFADVGYDCGLIGKLHLATASQSVEPRTDDGYRYWEYSHAPRDDWAEGHDYADWVQSQGGDLNALRESEDRVPTELHQTTWASERSIEFIEQPLSPDGPNAREAQAQLFRESALPLIADENCVSEDDVPRCVDHFHGINIKLCKCGGLTPARRMIANARELGLKVMVGCMTESSVGISAAAQLAPLLDYADLDGAVLLAEDAADGVQLHKGQLTFLNESGLGIQSLK